MKNKALKIGFVASVLPHLFCCVMPIALSIIGLVSPELAHVSVLPEWLEPWLFVFSALMLGFSWVMVLQKCPCHDCEKQNHYRQRVFLGFLTVVFIISVILHIVTELH